MDERVKTAHGRHHFFGVDFTTGTIPQIRELVAQAARSVRTTVVVTPNVDHIVGLSERLPDEVRSTYFSADTFFCDSKIIGRLARWNDLDLTPRTGTDRVTDVLACDALQDLTVAVAGPTREQTQKLRERFPGWRFIHIETPQKLVRGTPEWQACVDEASRQPWNILLSCLSFPKQEIFACDVRAARKSGGGVILCVGAAVDFLSGSQARAPMFFQRFGLEWFHRLITNPRRLWKRYLVEGPKIFLLYRKRRREGTLL